MNKASAKEPSMDEILSSIRQIIADDDAGITPSAPPVGAAPGDAPEPAPVPEATPAPEMDIQPEEPLSLSADQIFDEEPSPAPELAVEEELAEVTEALLEDDVLGDSDIVDPGDISFDEDPMDDVPEPVAHAAAIVEPPAPAPPAPEPAMPDPDLSADMAEKLLEPATGEAVKATFSKLSNVALGAQSLTIENMIREMLRPMLKEWLDENLPSVVEKMVESEIERISRGG